MSRSTRATRLSKDVWPLAAIDRVARQQHGLVTRRQLLELGLSTRAIERGLARGALVSVRPGVYSLPGVKPTQDQAWLAAVLAARAEVVLSHGSAAASWGLRGFGVPDRIDLLTTGHRPRLPGTRFHSTVSLPDVDRTVLRGVPITTSARTLVDACGLVSFHRFERAVDDALRRGVVHLPTLVWTFEAIPISGRRRRRPMERVLAERVPGYNSGGSDAELDVMKILRDAGVSPLPIQQYRLVVEGRTYRIDFAWPETKIALEFDGREYHTRVSEFHADQERIRRIQRADWTRWPLTDRTSRNEIIALGMLGAGMTAD